MLLEVDRILVTKIIDFRISCIDCMDISYFAELNFTACIMLLAILESTTHSMICQSIKIGSCIKYLHSWVLEVCLSNLIEKIFILQTSITQNAYHSLTRPPNRGACFLIIICQTWKPVLSPILCTCSHISVTYAFRHVMQ